MKGMMDFSLSSLSLLPALLPSWSKDQKEKKRSKIKTAVVVGCEKLPSVRRTSSARGDAMNFVKVCPSHQRFPFETKFKERLTISDFDRRDQSESSFTEPVKRPLF